MNIQWFPGHMTRAKREMQEKLKQVDVLIELRDARCPLSTLNPLILDLAKNMPKLIVLTKKDMADAKALEAWMSYLKDEQTEVIALDVLKDATQSRVIEAVLKVMQPKFDRWKSRGIQARKIKAMVAGIPNVGKSTLINQLAKKKIMVSANRPGVTMALKWANVHPKLDVLDTPGVLWPKFDDPKTGVVLALSGSIAEKVLPTQELAIYAYDFMCKHYAHLLKGFDTTSFDTFILDLAKQRNLVKNDDYRISEAQEVFLRELKTGKLGAVCFEFVEDLA
jgi:ribosome biogenesis GTPase A